MRLTGKDQRIQALRGVAAVLVVMLHARATLDWMGRPSSVVAALIPASGFGVFGVDLFFVISGVVMGMAVERTMSPRQFLRARLIRVVPTFWVAAIITTAVAFLLNEPPPRAGIANSITIFPVLDAGVMDMPVPAVGWTLAFELFFYTIVALSLYLPSPKRRHAIVGTLLLSAIIGEVIQPVRVPMLGIMCNAMLLEFALGLFVQQAARHRTCKRCAPLLIAAGLGPLLGSGLIDVGFSGAPEAVVAGQTSAVRVLAWGVPSALLLAGILARPDRMRAGSMLARLGDASYSIYLIHYPVMMLLAAAWPVAVVVGNDMFFVMLVGSAVLAGLIMHRWIERPLLARLRADAPQSTRSIAGLTG